MSDTPNMNLPLPTTSVTSGPVWGNQNTACFNAIDSHDHSTGKGVPINPAGLDINDDLTMAGNNLTNANSLGMNSLSAALTALLQTLQVVGVDLYYIDGAGNAVRITQSGSVTGSAGTITGLPSGTASASFAAGAFTFQSATSTPATMNVGPLVIGEQTASPHKVTLQSATSLASDFAITLPSAQGAANSIWSNNGSGGTSFVSPDNSTFGVSGGNYKVLNSGITATQLATDSVITAKIDDEAVTQEKLAPANDVTGGSGGSTIISSTSYVNVTGLSGTITGIGRPVMIVFTSEMDNGNVGYMTLSNGVQLTLQLTRNGVPIQACLFLYSGVGFAQVPPSFTFMDPSPPAGSLAYQVRAKVNTSSAEIVYGGLYIKEL